MKRFQHKLWGYELHYPDDWAHRSLPAYEAFAANPAALERGFEGAQPGHLLVSAEFNAGRKPVQPVWTHHLGMVAGMLGAKQVGSAPWHMGGGVGFEAEVRLPKKEQQRLWTGVLERGFTLLKFFVQHPLEDRGWFEEPVTGIIKSLRFPESVEGVEVNEAGIPIPPGYEPADPRAVIPDIEESANWLGYEGESSVGGLQAFYLREAQAAGWEMGEFVPFPAEPGLGFARLTLAKGEKEAVVGILPVGKETVGANSTGTVVIKIGP